MGRYTEEDKEILYELKQLQKELIFSAEYCQQQNGLPYCKNCGLDWEDVTARIGLAIYHLKDKYRKKPKKII